MNPLSAIAKITVKLLLTKCGKVIVSFVERAKKGEIKYKKNAFHI